MGEVAIHKYGGGGGTKLFAAIGVKFSAGSTLTCTCKENGKVLTAKTTSGQWVFAIPEIGTWIVTSTDPADSTKTKSQSVSITSEGQFESVALSYRYYLFNKGSVVTWTPEARRADEGDTATVDSTIYCKAVASTGYRSGVAYTDVIDLTKYSKLCVNFTAVTKEAYFGLVTSTVVAGNDVDEVSKWSASQKVTSTGTMELDISSFASTKNLCVIVGTDRDGNYIRELEADQVWLE